MHFSTHTAQMFNQKRSLLDGSMMRSPRPSPLQHFASLRTNAFSPSYRPLGFTVGKHQRSEQKLSANWTQPTASLSPKSKRTRPMADCSGLLRDIEGEGDRWGGLTYFLWRSSTLRNIPTYIQHFLTKTKHFHKENWTFRYFILTILSVLQRNTPTSSLPLLGNAHSGGYWADAPGSSPAASLRKGGELALDSCGECSVEGTHGHKRRAHAGPTYPVAGPSGRNQRKRSIQ